MTADHTEPWRSHLDRVLSEIELLDSTLRGVPGSELGPIAAQLRGANRKLWRLVDQLEAGRVQYIYDTLALFRDVTEMTDDPEATVADRWLALVEADLITINHKELLRRAAKKGLVVEKYLNMEGEEE